MYRGNGTDKIGAEVRSSYLAFNLNHFFGRTDILCRYDLNLVGILRVLVDIFYNRGIA